MAAWQVRAPVAFLIFNRPDTTARVFAAIRAARPAHLLVVADGPRAHVPTDAERCAATRAVIDAVDWDCEVLANYADANMGCKRRVASGLDWVFDTVEEAIILEDDCLPHPTFFRYCDELLERYRYDERVMGISGDHFLDGRAYTDASYYFSRFSFIWGWATWRRAWRRYDVEMTEWPGVRDGGGLPAIAAAAPRYWSRLFERAHRGEIDTWDYAWLFAIWLHGGLSIAPHTNLVSNIGFGAGATHTVLADPSRADLPVTAMPFPLRHPQLVMPDQAADRFVQRTRYSPGPLTLVRRLAQRALRSASRQLA